jgi:hypothetical protein
MSKVNQRIATSDQTFIDRLITFDTTPKKKQLILVVSIR